MSGRFSLSRSPQDVVAPQGLPMTPCLDLVITENDFMECEKEEVGTDGSLITTKPISGIIIIATGAIVLANTNDYNHFLDPAVVSLCIILIVVGALIFIIASLGCFGAIRESYCLLMTFAACLIVIFLVEIAVGTASAVYQDSFVQGLNESIKNYSTNEDDKKSWDTIHQELKCCGINGPISWQGQNVPHSCCHNDEVAKVVSKYCLDNAVGKFMYEEGCLDKLKQEVKSNSKILIGVGVGIAFIEVIGIILSCWLAFTIRREDQDK